MLLCRLCRNSVSYTGGETKKSFILHYNFPPFSVGETGCMGGMNRREIGHGALAERSIAPVIPSNEDFPYAIRISSEVCESNGFTSMASVCSGALMDAGVPIKTPVAGIRVGLVIVFDGDVLKRYTTLADILGSEDHFGDMDFKLCGTREGVTGFRLDLKLCGALHTVASIFVQPGKQLSAAEDSQSICGNGKRRWTWHLSVNLEAWQIPRGDYGSRE